MEKVIYFFEGGIWDEIGYREGDTWNCLVKYRSTVGSNMNRVKFSEMNFNMININNDLIKILFGIE